MKNITYLMLGTALFLALSASAEDLKPQPSNEAKFEQADRDAENAFSPAELEQTLAPIALYPDSILSHILIASTYPIEIVQAQRWSKNNPEYKGSQAVEAVDERSGIPVLKHSQHSLIF